VVVFILGLVIGLISSGMYDRKIKKTEPDSKFDIAGKSKDVINKS
jgi:hypothetical protein